MNTELRTMKYLFFLFVLVGCPLHIQANYTTTRNYDFVKDGIYYRVLSPTTVAVTPKKYEYVTYTPSDEPNYIGKYVFESGHSGAVIIPETVSYNSNTYTVTAIDEYAFVTGMNGVEVDDPIYNSEVTSVTVPGTIKTLNETFQHCSQLRWVVLKEGIERLQGYMFYECPLLEEIYIPSTVTYIGTPSTTYQRFVGNCPMLSRIHVEWTTPFALPNGAFKDQDITKVSLYVPYGCKAIYESTDNWKNFKEIIEIGGQQVEDASISIIEATVRCGGQATIPVQFESKLEFGGLQCEVILPEGVTLNKVTKTERLSEAFTLTKSLTGENTYQILLYNIERATFADTEGALFNLVVDVDENMAAGDYEIQVKEIVASDVDGNETALADVSAALHVAQIMTGDANNDGKVNVTDIMAVASYILKYNVPGFNAAAADVNDDGKINVTDIMGIANIILQR